MKSNLNAYHLWRLTGIHWFDPNREFYEEDSVDFDLDEEWICLEDFAVSVETTIEINDKDIFKTLVIYEVREGALGGALSEHLVPSGPYGFLHEFWEDSDFLRSWNQVLTSLFDLGMGGE